jgi:glutathione synthase/RimK-type ligase-like ATP-grasp enzyme
LERRSEVLHIRNLNVPINNWAVPDFVQGLARKTLERLGLELGVIDLKETPNGELIWLEVNPQGQFLFLEPFTTLNLAENFADYLLNTAFSS